MTAKHTPTPFKIRTKKRIFNDGEKYIEIEGADLKIVLLSGIWGMPEAETNAKFIVTACNAHDMLVETLRLALMELTRPSDTKRVIADILEALKLAGEEV